MNLDAFLELVFRNVKSTKDGVPVLVDAADGFEGRRWKRGGEVGGRTLYTCISTVVDVPRANKLSRKTESLVATHAIVLDDIGTKVDDLKVNLDPSIIIETSPGNFQYWYLLTSPADPAKAAALIEGIAAAGLTDMGARRADRIVRVPGSINRKPELEEPFAARIVHIEPRRTYTLSEIELGLGVTSTEPRDPRSSRPPSLEEGETDPVFDWLLEHGHVIEGPNPRGWYAIHCPWENEHTGDVDHGTDYMPGRPGVFKCLHSHGPELDNTSLRQWIEDQDPAAELGLVPRETLASLASGLAGALQRASEGGTMFGGLPRGAAPRPVVGPQEGLVERLAEAIRDVVLDPILLPDHDQTANGHPKTSQTVTAVRVYEVMRRIGMTARWNALARQPEAVFEGIDWYDPGADPQRAGLATLVHACARCAMKGEQTIADHFTARALERPFSPVLSWMKSTPWDGVDRIGPLCETITMRGVSTEPWRNKWRDAAIRRWLVQAVEAVLNFDRGENAYDVGYTLVLQGPQDRGKSRWVSHLMPSSWVSDGVSLRLDANERDAVMRATTTPITELGEVDASFRKSDIAALKNFLTTRVDRYRLPWGRREISMPRTTAFVATVNPEDFLVDPTGERRFWPLAIDLCDWNHGLDLQQLWAQALSLQEAGTQYWLNSDEKRLHDLAAGQHRTRNELTEMVDELLQRRRAVPDVGLWDITRVSDLLRHYGVKSQGNVTFSNLRALLTRHGFEWRASHGREGWFLPPLTVALTEAQKKGFNVIRGGKAEDTSSTV